MAKHYNFHIEEWLSEIEEIEGDFELQGFYFALMNLIFLSDGALKNDDHRNAHKLYISKNRYKKLKMKLIELKFLFEKNGFLLIEACDKELERIFNNSKKASENAKKSVEKRKKTAEVSQSVSAIAEPPLDQSQSRSLNFVPTKDKDKDKDKDNKKNIIKKKPHRFEEKILNVHEQKEYFDQAKQIYEKQKIPWDDERIWMVFERFSDHWKAQSGTNAVKQDWLAAWRNWVRGDVEFRQNHNVKPRASSDYMAKEARKILEKYYS